MLLEDMEGRPVDRDLPDQSRVSRAGPLESEAPT